MEVVQTRVKKEPDEHSDIFEEVVSLGSLCAAAAWLQDQGLRVAAFPFDWMHSSPAMVRHCILDDFATLLKRRSYFKAGRSGEQCGIGHRVYSRKLLGAKKQVVWRHHDPLTKEADFQLVQRCVARFRQVLHNNGKRRLFVLLVPVRSLRVLRQMRGEDRNDSKDKGGPLMGADSEIKGLFQDLCSAGVKHFHMDVVRLCMGSASQAKKGQPIHARHLDETRRVSNAGETLTIHELHCLGGHTGLRFKNGSDEAKFASILLGTGAKSRKFRIGSIMWSKPKCSLSRKSAQQHGKKCRNYSDDNAHPEEAPATQCDNVRNLLISRSKSTKLNYSRTEAWQPESSCALGTSSKKRRRSSGSFAVREFSKSLSKRMRLEMLERAKQDECIIDVADSDDGASPSHMRDEPSLAVSRPQAISERIFVSKGPPSASAPSVIDISCPSPNSPSMDVGEPMFELPSKTRKRRLRGKQALPQDEKDETVGEAAEICSAGHTLKPAELGHRVAVTGDGWGNPGPGFKAIVTEADNHTFTVVVIDGPDAWKEAHVLREHCVQVGGG